MNNFTEESIGQSSNVKLGWTVNELCNCVVLPIICGAGISGNIANLITLASAKLRAVSYMYLRALGVADLLCMLFVLIFVFFEIAKLLQYDAVHSSYTSAWYRAHAMLPLINASISAGILIIVALTVERYISVKWPLFFRQWNSPQVAYTSISIAYILPVLSYIPMCWQMEVVPAVSYSYYSNVPFALYSNNRSLFEPLEVVRYGVGDNSVLLHSTGYRVYKWLRETLLKIIPIISLAVLNLLLAWAFKEMRDRRKRLSITSLGIAGTKGSMSSSTTANPQPTVREDRNLYFLLISIAVMFFICNTPAAINLMFISEENKKSKAYSIFRATANFMEITNHAVNFYVFCLCSRDYRETFLQKFPCVKKVHDGTTVAKRRFSETVTRMQLNVVESGRLVMLSASRRASKCVNGSNGNWTELNGRSGAARNLRLSSVAEYELDDAQLAKPRYCTIYANKQSEAFAPVAELDCLDE